MSKKEEARYVKSLYNLSEHIKLLPLLNWGDHVSIQNQTDYFYNKWGGSSKTKRLSPLSFQG